MNLKGFTDPRVLRRFVILMGIATFVMFTFWAVLNSYVDAPVGDYEVRQGDIFIGDQKWDEALARFDAALAISPNHRGALMGRGIALLQSGRLVEAEAEFTHLIDFMSKTLEPDDMTGIAVYAAAYANRGILYDRTGRYEEALADYIEALKIDEGAIDGPAIVDRVIFGTPRPATVRKRAIYLYEQLALPAAERVFKNQEMDAKERMYKPY